MNVQNNSHRLKATQPIRDLLKPRRLNPSNLVYPLFIKDSLTSNKTVLPGVTYFDIQGAILEIESAVELGVSSFMIFCLSEERDDDGTIVLKEDAFPNRVFRRIRSEFDEKVNAISDVCLCEYTTTRSCALVKDGCIDLDRSNEILSRIALRQVEAGATMVAPAGMLDGQVKAIRQRLDENGFWHVPIMSYIKADSVLYTPYGHVVEKAEMRKLLPSTTRRVEVDKLKFFLDKIALEIEEGTDILLIKPAISNLDIIRHARQTYTAPVAAYQVSGEYAMIKAAAQQGYLDEDRTLLEMIGAIQRAGADIIVTYYAKKIAKMMREYR